MAGFENAITVGSVTVHQEIDGANRTFEKKLEIVRQLDGKATLFTIVRGRPSADKRWSVQTTYIELSPEEIAKIKEVL